MIQNRIDSKYNQIQKRNVNDTMAIGSAWMIESELV